MEAGSTAGALGIDEGPRSAVKCSSGATSSCSGFDIGPCGSAHM